MLVRGIPGVGRTVALPAALVVASTGAAVAVLAASGNRILEGAVAAAAIVGLVQLGRGIHGLIVMRLRADRWLGSATEGVVPPAYAWRAVQLTSLEQRRTLARSLRRVVERRSRLGMRLTVARERRISLEALAKRLERGDEPVTPAGMLRIAELITAGGGPLWGTSADALGEAIDRILAVLVPRPAGCVGHPS